ncbi:MAG: DNA-3-methyladenine glycosylase [Thaumarchaeota archaeon]|nr:DNA-3-methyladenine glycosylase [Nitrososphaerota archaeon]
MEARLGRSFFERYTPFVARDLLGCTIVRILDGIRMAGEIVEAEAYRGKRDPASHAYVGKTPRNAVMFGEPGHAYIYFTYGFHHMLNFATESEGTPGAVLIRAIHPTEGESAMKANRGVGAPSGVTDGPGKLTKALKIDRDFNGEDLVTSERLFVERGRAPKEFGTSSRVGIREGAGYRWRFYVKGDAFVSKGRPTPSKPRTHN